MVKMGFESRSNFSLDFKLKIMATYNTVNYQQLAWKEGLMDLQKEGTDSFIELINKLPAEIHTIVYTDIFFLATSEMNSKGHELTVRLQVRLTLSVPQFLLWPWSVLSTLFIKEFRRAAVNLHIK